MTILQQSVRLGAQRPRFQHLPPEKAASSGQEAIDLAASAGLHLDDWQQWVLRESLAERADGRWCAFEVGLILPRQNGKNAILEALELAAIYLFGERLVVHSAHRFDTATEHFLRMKELIQGTPDLDRQVAPNGFVTANGKEAIKFRNGARIKFIARSKAGGRGFTGDRIILDEAYDLSAKAIGAMMPTLSTRPNAQVWYTSSAPMATSQVLHSVRNRGHAADPGDRLFFAEWAADPNADPGDVAQWYAANPAMGIRISEEYVHNEFRAMREMPEEFARERLGVPDDVDGGLLVFPLDLWVSLEDRSYTFSASVPVCVGLDVSVDGSWSTVAAVQVDRAGVPHLEVDQQRGTAWLAARCRDIMAKRPGTTISVAGNGPVAALVPSLRAAGVQVAEVAGVDVGRAASAFVDAVTNRKLRHLGNSSMQNAISGAAKRQTGDTWQFGRASSTADITPLVAATLALAGTTKKQPAALWAAWS